MSDTHDVTEAHASGLLHYAHDHKWIVAGLAAALILGLLAARKNNKAGTMAATTNSLDGSGDTPYYQSASWIPSGSGTNVSTVSSSPASTDSIPNASTILQPTVYYPPSAGATVPFNATTAAPSIGASTSPVMAPASTAPVKQVPIVTGPSAGQLTTVSLSSTVASPGLGTGGANYYTASPADQAEIANEQQQMKAGNLPFINSEIVRTNEVIANRQAAGLSISDQLDYANQLTTAKAHATTAPSSGITSATGSSGATSTLNNEAQYLTNLANGRNPDGTAATSGNMAWASAQLGATTYITSAPAPAPAPIQTATRSSNSSSSQQETQQQLHSDFVSHPSQQVVDGHTNPNYSTGKTISQNDYKALAAQVAAGGSAAQAALAQLSGARVV